MWYVFGVRERDLEAVVFFSGYYEGSVRVLVRVAGFVWDVDAVSRSRVALLRVSRGFCCEG